MKAMKLNNSYQQEQEYIWNNSDEYCYIARTFSTQSKTDELRDLNPHYSDTRFSGGKAYSIFGKEDKKFIYVYNDRLEHALWEYCIIRVSEEGTDTKTAEGFEKALQYYYDDPKLELGNIQVGVNVSNGYAYQVYGFTSDACNSTCASEKLQKMQSSKEYEKLKEYHKVAVKAEKAVTSSKSALSNAEDRIKQIEKEIVKLRESLPTLNEKIGVAEAEFKTKNEEFEKIKKTTVLPLPYHAIVYVY